jgi:hypothetical protein
MVVLVLYKWNGNIRNYLHRIDIVLLIMKKIILVIKIKH